MKNILFLVGLLCCGQGFGQSQNLKALFLGNSYTYVNAMPTMVNDMALSTGDTLNYDSNTPGGYTIEGHTTNATTIQKLKLGYWNYVIVQDQSQMPSFKTYNMDAAHYLDSLIKMHNECATTLFYMTWGRKNGDSYNPNWPVTSTYLGMDSILRMRYMEMAEINKAEVSPVGAVWRHIRQTDSTMELYAADGSHPSVAGSYAAACSFYTAIFRKDPTLITYNSTLTASEANFIKAATKTVVYDNLLKWHIGEFDHLKKESCQPSSTPNEIANSTNNSLNLKIYPNPNSGVFRISGDAPFQVEVFNLQGVKILAHQSHENEVLELDLSAHSKGIYLVSTTVGELVQHSKIVIQ